MAVPRPVHDQPSRAITVTFVIPVFGILWGALFLNEQVTAGMLEGCAIVLVGTALATGVIKRIPGLRQRQAEPAHRALIRRLGRAGRNARHGLLPTRFGAPHSFSPKVGRPAPGSSPRVLFALDRLSPNVASTWRSFTLGSSSSTHTLCYTALSSYGLSPTCQVFSFVTGRAARRSPSARPLSAFGAAPAAFGQRARTGVASHVQTRPDASRHPAQSRS